MYQYKLHSETTNTFHSDTPKWRKYFSDSTAGRPRDLTAQDCQTNIYHTKYIVFIGLHYFLCLLPQDRSPQNVPHQYHRVGVGQNLNVICGVQFRSGCDFGRSGQLGIELGFPGAANYIDGNE